MTKKSNSNSSQKIRKSKSNKKEVTTKLTRKTIFAQAAKKLRSEFEQLLGTPDKTSKGQSVEKILIDFLNDHLPKRFQAGSGFIIDSENNISRQTDVIIYDALNCPIYRATDSSSIFPNDNTAIVIEVKSMLDKQKIMNDAKKIAVIKKLKKRPYYLNAPISNPLGLNYQTKGFIFAFNSSISLHKIAEHYIESIRRLKKNEYQHCTDAIFVLDKGMVCLSMKHGKNRWIASPAMSPIFEFNEGTHIGVVSIGLEKQTLDTFFRVSLEYLLRFVGSTYLLGFPWILTEPSKQRPLYYLGSITYEKDPKTKMEILEKYKREALEF